MTYLRPSLGGSLGFKPRFVSIKAQAFYSLKYRNQRLHSEGLISAGVSAAPHGGIWHLYLTEALGRCVLATEVLVVLVFVGLWSNRKLGQSLARRVYKQPSLVLGVSILLTTLRHLGNAHSGKILVPAEVFEHRVVNFPLCQ